MDLDKLKATAGLDLDGKRVLVRADLNLPSRTAIPANEPLTASLVPSLAVTHADLRVDP